MEGPRDPNDLALMRARKFMRRLKHGPFLAFIIDENKDKVHYFHTEGINSEAIAAIRTMLDELEATLAR